MLLSVCVDRDRPHGVFTWRMWDDKFVWCNHSGTIKLYDTSAILGIQVSLQIFVLVSVFVYECVSLKLLLFSFFSSSFYNHQVIVVPLQNPRLRVK